MVEAMINAGTFAQNNRIEPQVNMFAADTINITRGTFIQNNTMGGKFSISYEHLRVK
jgi:hypothetical protein